VHKEVATDKLNMSMNREPLLHVTAVIYSRRLQGAPKYAKRHIALGSSKYSLITSTRYSVSNIFYGYGKLCRIFIKILCIKAF